MIFLLVNLVFGCQIFCRLYQPVRNYFLCLVNLVMSVNFTAVGEVLWIGWGVLTGKLLTPFAGKNDVF